MNILQWCSSFLFIIYSLNTLKTSLLGPCCSFSLKHNLKFIPYLTPPVKAQKYVL